MEHTNKNNQDSTNQLFSAIRNNNLEKVKNILAQGIDVNKQNNDGNTPLNFAVFHNHIEIVKELLNKEGIDVNKPDNDGETPLYRAALHKHTEIVNELLKKDSIKFLNKQKLAMLLEKENFKSTLTEYITNFALNDE